MNKVKQMPRFTRTMKGVPLPVGGFQPSDIPALQRGTEWMVSQCHKAMTKVKKRYLHGQYCIDDPDWKQLDTNPQSHRLCRTYGCAGAVRKYQFAQGSSRQHAAHPSCQQCE